VKQQQAPIERRYERKLIQFAFGSIPIVVIVFGSERLIGIFRDQWHLGYWQRELAYTVVAIGVLAVVGTAWLLVDRRFDLPAGHKGSAGSDPT
jgi:hypothetical protein